MAGDRITVADFLVFAMYSSFMQSTSKGKKGLFNLLAVIISGSAKMILWFNKMKNELKEYLNSRPEREI